MLLSFDKRFTNKIVLRDMIKQLYHDVYISLIVKRRPFDVAFFVYIELHTKMRQGLSCPWTLGLQRLLRYFISIK